jgi:SAM-dependent methyltransferase
MPGTPEETSAGGSPDYLAPYADAVRAHGATFEATLWASKEKQVGRFAVIAEMADLTGRVIVDAGCGLGDLASFCEEQGIAYGKYIGLEAMPDMVRAGAARGLPEARFETVDFASDTECFERLARSDGVDLVVFSGSLNTFEPEHAFGVVKEAFRHAREGVVFNFLSSRNHERHAINPAPAKRFDPASMLDRALALTPRVRFRQDYFDGHDATIAMMHSERVRTRG